MRKHGIIYPIVVLEGIIEKAEKPQAILSAVRSFRAEGICVVQTQFFDETIRFVTILTRYLQARLRSALLQLSLLRN